MLSQHCNIINVFTLINVSSSRRKQADDTSVSTPAPQLLRVLSPKAASFREILNSGKTLTTIVVFKRIFIQIWVNFIHLYNMNAYSAVCTGLYMLKKTWISKMLSVKRAQEEKTNVHDEDVLTWSISTYNTDKTDQPEKWPEKLFLRPHRQSDVKHLSSQLQMHKWYISTMRTSREELRRDEDFSKHKSCSFLGLHFWWRVDCSENMSSGASSRESGKALHWQEDRIEICSGKAVIQHVQQIKDRFSM